VAVDQRDHAGDCRRCPRANVPRKRRGPASRPANAAS
jgi:hypothetical protein